MRKAWHIVGGIALGCLVLGVLGIAVGFFTGSSPVIIQTHGNLTEYMQRLNTNWEIIKNVISELYSNWVELCSKWVLSDIIAER